MLHEPQMERTGDPEEIKQKMMSPLSSKRTMQSPKLTSVFYNHFLLLLLYKWLSHILLYYTEHKKQHAYTHANISYLIKTWKHKYKQVTPHENNKQPSRE